MHDTTPPENPPTHTIHDTTSPQNLPISSPPYTTYTIPNTEVSRPNEVKCCGCMTLRGGVILMTFFAFVMTALEIWAITSSSSYESGIISYIAISMNLVLVISGFFAVRPIGWKAAMLFNILWWMTTLLIFGGTIVVIAARTSYDASQLSCESMYDYSQRQACESSRPIIYIIVNIIQIMLMIYGGVCSTRFARLRKAEHKLKKSHVDGHQLENRVQNTV